MGKKLPIIVGAVLLLLATGFLHGRITNRWGYSDLMQASLDKLNHLPLVLNDWDGTVTNIDVKPETTRFSGGFVLATYVQRQTGDAVNVTLVCGRSGPLSLHPPTVCFPAHGYSQKNREAKTAVDVYGGGKVELLSADYTLEQPTGEEQIHIRWCYGYDGEWAVPDNPRVTLANRPAVYKLYVSRAGLANRFAAGEDPVDVFLRSFLPELKKVLFAP